MKSKLVILSLLLSGAAVVATAQTKEKYYSESWKDNIFISVGVGAQAGTNPDTKFGKTVTPLINLSVGTFKTRAIVELISQQTIRSSIHFHSLSIWLETNQTIIGCQP